MQQIGNKLIEIQVTDSSLATPGAGAGFLQNMADQIGAYPALLIGIIALLGAISLAVVALVLSRKRSKHAKKPLYALPALALVSTALAITPMMSFADSSTRLNNTPISITVDKNQALTASDSTVVTLDKDATDYAEIFADLTSDFDGKLGSGINISAAPVSDDSPAVDITTSTDLIYTTPGAITAGTNMEFEIIVEISQDLPVGDYSSGINFYGDYTMIEEFKFTVDTTLDRWGDGYSYNVATYSNIGAVKDPNLKLKNINYDWLINCDTVNDPSGFYAVSGVSNDNYNNRLTCHYDEPGQYQITIQPNGQAVMGWLDAYGGPGGEWENSAFLSIDTPLTNNMRTANASYRFAYMFYSSPNMIGIPSDLFSSIDTIQDTNLEGMFEGTFGSCSYEGVSIPSTLFSTIDTINAVNMSHMFNGTFSGFASNSEEATIPYDLFHSIDTSNATNLTAMFANTFRQYGRSATTGSIPAQLFDSIDTTNAIELSNMFYYTFEWYVSSSENGTIPQGLFDSIYINDEVIDLSNMFSYTFAQYSKNTNNGTIPDGLFDTITTANVTNLEGIFRGTFNSYGGSIIPQGLFDSIDTSSATNMKSMFNDTFYFSKGSNIPEDLFTTVRVNAGDETLMMFYSTFGYYTDKIGTGTSDINKIWGDADLSGITASAAGGYTGAFYSTFNGMSSLKGSAQDFINNYLSFSAPTARAYTFTGTGVTDLSTLATNWK